MEFNKLKESVARIELAVCGDHEMGNPGIVVKVQDHEKRIDTIERLKESGASVWKVAVIVASFLVGLIGVVGVTIKFFMWVHALPL